jgi:hypothetical protein
VKQESIIWLLIQLYNIRINIMRFTGFKRKCPFKNHYSMFTRFYERVGILITHWKALAKPQLFTKRVVYGPKTSLTPPRFATVRVPSQKSELSCMSVLGVSILCLSTIFQLVFWNFSDSVEFFGFFLHFIMKYSKKISQKETATWEIIQLYT